MCSFRSSSRILPAGRLGAFACALIFLIAAVTDWFDGYLARRWNQSTRFGAFLDPVADKVMVAIAMVLVAEHYHTVGDAACRDHDWP